MTDDFRMQPVAVADATKQLNALADRADKLMATEAPNLTVTASAHDEVSGRVATTLNDVHAIFVKSSDQGTNEMREIAATLNGHTADIMAAEHDFTV
jgi:hypothetical protein